MFPCKKKKGKRDKNKYRSVSILCNATKVNERRIQKQMSGFFENLLSTRFQCATVSVGFDRKTNKKQISERSFSHIPNRFIESIRLHLS